MRTRLYSPTLAVSVRPVLQRLFLVTLLAMSLLLLYAERQQRDWAQAIRLSLLEASAPLANAVASPANAIEALAQQWQSYWHVHAQNAQLRSENDALLRWKAAALALEAENDSLRRLMHYQPESTIEFSGAKVVGSPGGALTHRLRIDAGLDNGIGRYMPVINNHGLIGRVLYSSARHAEVLMLSDMNSRIPVMLQPSGEKALLIGAHQELPYLKLANPKAEIALGEEVLSADDGGLLPGGLYIGTLFANQGRKLEVLPAYQSERVDYVRVLTR